MKVDTSEWFSGLDALTRDKVLTELVGRDRADLDLDQAVDLLLDEAVKAWMKADAKARRLADKLSLELKEFSNGVGTPRRLSASSLAADYDTAVTACETWSEALGLAAYAYKKAYGLLDDSPVASGQTSC